MVLENVFVENQRDPEGDDRERDSMQPQRGQADDDAEDCRGEDADDDPQQVAAMHAGHRHACPIGGHPRERGLAQRDLAGVSREQNKAQDGEAPDDRECGVELERGVEADRQLREDRERDDRDRETDDVAWHHLATAGNPRGERMIRTASITRSAIRRGRPSDWTHIVG